MIYAWCELCLSVVGLAQMTGCYLTQILQNCKTAVANHMSDFQCLHTLELIGWTRLSIKTDYKGFAMVAVPEMPVPD